MECDLDPITEVYRAMENLGYERGAFEEWEKRIELFHVTKTGGLAFVHDAKDKSVWWLNIHCPKEKPSNNTFEFLFQLATSCGCKLMKSYVKRAGGGRMLERVGFVETEKGLYERKAD